MSAVLEQPTAECASLAPAERHTLVALAESALRIASRVDLLACTSGPLQSLSSHGTLICGLGQIGAQGNHGHVRFDGGADMLVGNGGNCDEWRCAS